MELDVEQLLSLWETAVEWAAAQPLPIQLAIGLAVLSLAYFLYVVIATAIAAFYAAFFR